MSDGERRDRPVDDGESRIDVIGFVVSHGRTLALSTALATLLVALIAGIYLLWRQPTVTTAVVEFRPKFPGASQGTYPNGLPFAASDITAAQVIDQVFDSNTVGNYCDRSAFKGAFFVDQRATDYNLLEAEFTSRLAEPRLTPVERDRLQAEYRSRRSALPVQFRLVFARPEACQAMPEVLTAKVMTEVLQTWARQSEERRGVLRMRVQVLTPSILDVGLSGDGSRLIRADLLRTAFQRLIDNVTTIESRPGASLVKLTDRAVTFAEVRARLEDLVQARLEPLIVLAGRGLGDQSVVWAREALNAAKQDQLAAEGTTQAYRLALREYSGVPQAVDPAMSGSSADDRARDVQTLTPQIDRTFIDRILEMSESNSVFRQELTQQMVSADVRAVGTRERVAYYEHLTAALGRSSEEPVPAAEIEGRMEDIVRVGKELATQFNALYEEWSAVSLRPAAAMYETLSPVRQQVSRPFTRRSYVLLLFATFFVSLITATGVLFLRDRFAIWARRSQPRP